MTFLGKMFTGIIFVLSVCFFVVSLLVLGTHIDNKDLADKSKKAADKANAEKNALQEKLEQLKREYAIEQMARRTALASLQTQVSQIANDLSDKEKELRDLQSAHTAIVADAKTTSETLKARSAENELLREQMKSKQGRTQSIVQAIGRCKRHFQSSARRIRPSVGTMVRPEQQPQSSDGKDAGFGYQA